MNFIVGRMIISAMRTSYTDPHYCTAMRQAPHRRRNVAQGSLSSLAALPPRRAVGGAAWVFSETVFGMAPNLKQIILFASRPEPAPLEKPQGRTAGPALPRRGWPRRQTLPPPGGLYPCGEPCSILFSATGANLGGYDG